jgi:hypothetical protein
MQNHKTIKQIIFVITSLLLIFDFLLVPFVTEPFLFKNGIDEQYFFLCIFAIASWSYITWLNFSEMEKIKYLSPFFCEDKTRYYFHLRIALKLITTSMIILILLGFYSVIIQCDLAWKNILEYLSSR